MKIGSIIQNLLTKNFKPKTTIYISFTITLALSACNVDTSELQKELSNAKSIAHEVAKSATEGVSGEVYNINKPEDINKLITEFKAKAGADPKMDKIQFTFKDEKEGGNNISTLTCYCQNPQKPLELQVYTYVSNIGWQGPQGVEINVYGGDAEKFNLENDLTPLSSIDFNLIPKLAQAAVLEYATNTDFKRFSIVIIECKKDIAQSKIMVNYDGKLKSNGVNKTHSYHTDLTGKVIYKN